MVIIIGNGHGNLSSNPRQSYISHSTKTLRRLLNPTLPALGE